MGISNDVERLMNELRARTGMAGDPLPDIAPGASDRQATDLDASESRRDTRPGTAVEHEPVGEDAGLVELGPPLRADELTGMSGAGLSSEARGGLGPQVDGTETNALATEAARTEATDVSAAAAAPTSKQFAEPAKAGEERVKRLEAASNIAESLGLGYHLGSAIERIFVGASEGSHGVRSLQEATWLIERYVSIVQQRPVGADLQVTSLRLNRSGELIDELKALSAALDAQTAAEQSRRTIARGDGHALAPPQEPSSAEEAESRTPDKAPHGEPPPEPLGREITLMLVRWSLITVAIIIIVLVVTLIGQWL